MLALTSPRTALIRADTPADRVVAMLDWDIIATDGSTAMQSATTTSWLPRLLGTITAPGRYISDWDGVGMKPSPSTTSSMVGTF